MSQHRRPHLQVLVDFYHCAVGPQALQHSTGIRHTLREAIQKSGMRIVDSLFHRFAGQGQGVTGVFIVAESHLIVHTWPEHRFLTLDIFFCNATGSNERKAQHAVRWLVAHYRPRWITTRRIRHTQGTRTHSPGPRHPPTLRRARPRASAVRD